MDYAGWVETAPGIHHPYDHPSVRGLMALLAILVAGTIIGLRLHRGRLQHKRPLNISKTLKRWVFHFYIMASLSDVLAFLGLVYFIISGRSWALLGGGIAAYLGYALAYPVRRDLSELFKMSKRERADEENIGS